MTEKKVFEILFEEFDDGELKAALELWCSTEFGQEDDKALIRVLTQAKERAMEIADDRKARGL